jgi:hypothetical protein
MKRYNYSGKETFFPEEIKNAYSLSNLYASIQVALEDYNDGRDEEAQITEHEGDVKDYSPAQYIRIAEANLKRDEDLMDTDEGSEERDAVYAKWQEEVLKIAGLLK